MTFPANNSTGAERQLREEGERALRNPHGKLLLALYISRLQAPRAHHVRVARVLLQDVAQRHGGQVFAMRNNDLVLLCNEAGPAQSSSPYAPEGLPHTLNRLFGLDVPESGPLTSLWALETEPQCLHRILENRTEAGCDVAPATFARSQPVSLAALLEVVSKAPLADLVAQQTGISLSSDRHQRIAARLAPAFQKLSFDLTKLNIAALLSEALGDPFLFQHFTEMMHVRLLHLLEEDLMSRGRLLRSILQNKLPIMVELGLRAIVSPAFAPFSRLAGAAGAQLWVAISLREAGAELDLLDHARGILELTGARLIINGFEKATLRLVRPDRLQADVIVLNWEPGLPVALADRSRLNDWSGACTGILLAGVDNEAALVWGQTVGIALFQGALIDQIQAATRMQACHSATACTVRQCRTRAAALTMPGRAGCANPALLSLAANATP